LGKQDLLVYSFELGNVGSDQDMTGAGVMTIPLLASGDRPQWIIVQSSQDVPVSIELGDDSLTVVTDGGHFQTSRYNSPMVIDVGAATKLAWEASASSTLNVVPLSNKGRIFI
jgi:hypothetical protein